MSNNFEKSHESWSSFFSFIWVVSGAAVGLGNIWKFPYMAGENGGSAFVLVYLSFLLLVSMPILIGELMIGRKARKNPVDSFLSLARMTNRSLAWRYVGYLGLFTLLLIFCFYSVVAGFSLGYLYFAITDQFFLKSSQEIEQLWGNFLMNPWILIFNAALFIFFTMVIINWGIKKGIEKACRLLMPGLILVLIALAVYAAFTDGFYPALKFLFVFDITELTPQVLISGLGHALFTLAVGACSMIAYGRYLSVEISIFRSALVVAILDTFIALLAGIAIFPLIFSHGLLPNQGPGLMFISLPIVFAKLSYGYVVGALFFILLFFAALSSSLSFAEPLIEQLMERGNLRRGGASLLISLVTFMGSVLCALSFNVLSEMKLFHWTIFDLFADFSTNLLLPIGAILIAIFSGLVIKKEDFPSVDQKYGRKFFAVWRWLVLVIAPCAITVVMLNSLIGMF